METALQRIIRKTGRRPVECRCRLCRQQCRIPCLGTPEDILRLLKAGYRERLAPTRWAVGLLLVHLALSAISQRTMMAYV